MTPATKPGNIVSHPPICVDFESAIVRNSYLAEAVLGALRARPALIFLLPIWLLKGRHYFKQSVYRLSRISPALLAYNSEMVSLLDAKKRAGHHLYLVTEMPASQAADIAEHLGIFSQVLGRDELAVFFGDTPFLYADRNFGVAGNVQAAKPSPIAACARAARLHQWAKNSLIFVPALLSHQFANPAKLWGATLAFLAFSFCASSFYLLNDLLDIEADRRHPRKRFRPFASAELSVVAGVWLILAGLSGTVLCASFLPLPAAGLIALYGGVSFLYSACLKQVLFLDTVVLAFLYTLRILVGGSASKIEISVWTLAFSIFFFLGLALLKRVVELVPAKANTLIAPGRRAYVPADLASVNSLASSALLVSVLITVLYINSPDVVKLYHHPQVLWLISLPLLYWIGRLLTLANRGLLTDDPLVFAFRDKVSYLVGVAVLVCAFFAS